MKAKSLILAALVVLSSVATTFAKEEPSKAGLVIVPVKGTEVFKVIYKSETAGKVKLNIYNESGAVVFSETLKSVEGFIRPLNFSGLQNGEYTIELIDAAGKRSEKISFLPVGASKIGEIGATAISTAHVSKLSSDNNKYLVALANKTAGTVTVKIYDGSENLIHTETKEISGNFAQVYAVKNAVGNLTFEVTNAAGVTITTKF
jgi:flagellar hook assembly protein FlgD